MNQALSRGGPVDTLRALQNPALGLHEVITDAAPLYHEEMSADKVESGVCLFVSLFNIFLSLLTNLFINF